MPFDLVEYKDKYRDFYGDSPLADVAKDAYARGYHQGEPDFNSWAKSSGIEPLIQEDIKRRVRRAWRGADIQGGVETQGTIPSEAAAAAELDDFFSSVASLVHLLYIGMGRPGP